jgi:hypothetical protein
MMPALSNAGKPVCKTNCVIGYSDANRLDDFFSEKLPRISDTLVSRINDSFQVLKHDF